MLLTVFSHGFPGQDRFQREVDVVVCAPFFLFLQNTARSERVEIFGDGQARHFQITLDELNLGIAVPVA